MTIKKFQFNEFLTLPKFTETTINYTNIYTNLHSTSNNKFISQNEMIILFILSKTNHLILKEYSYINNYNKQLKTEA